MRRALAALLLLAPLVSRATTTLELSQGAEALTGGRPAWRTSSLEATWIGERGAAGGASVRELSRFGLDDVEGALFAQAPLAGFVIGVEGSASPTWRFLPRWSAGARVERTLPAAWVAWVGARVSRYEGEVARSTATLASFGLEKYWGRWRAAATTTAVALDGAWSGGERIGLDLFYGAGSRVGASVAAGRELESVGAGQVLRTDVAAVSVAGAHALRGGWAVVWELAAVHQGDLYNRTGGRLGLRRSF